MAYNRFRTSICAIIGLAAVMAVASAAGQASGGGVAAKYPAGSIATVEAADRALAEAATERDAAEQRYATEQGNCYSKFFATSCMDEAHERRRKELADIRAVEVQANEFKRRERAAERDREVAQRKADSEAKLAEREKQLQQQQQQREAGGTADVKALPGAGKSSKEDSKSSALGEQDRTAQHEAKLKRIQAEEAANAAKRAENIAAYERKQQEAEKHLKEVESRKAEKERERAKKASSASSSSGSQ